MKRINFYEKTAYATGDFAGNIVWQMIMFFLPGFYTDTFGLSAAAAGTLFLTARIFDAVSDPFMGVLADRTKSRWGKFRPYILWFSIPYGLAAFLLFVTPQVSEAGKLVYAYSTYIFMMAVFTAITVPYNALSGVMTNNEKDRLSLNSFRFVGAYAGGLVIQGCSRPLVDYFGQGNDAQGYRQTMLLFGIVAVMFFLAAFVATRERIQPQKEHSADMRADFRDLMHNRPWRILFFFSLTFLVFVAVRSGAIMYYFEHYLHDKQGASWFMAGGTLLTMLTTLLSKRLSQWLGKRNGLFITTLIMGGSLTCFYFVRPDDYVLLYVVQAVFALASGPPMPLLWSMYADVADYSEQVNQRRATGLVFSAATFGIKFGAAIGSALLLYGLAIAGYTKAAPVQAESAVKGIRLLMSLVPAVIAVGTSFIILSYKLPTGYRTEPSVSENESTN